MDEPIRYLKVEAKNGSLIHIIMYHGTGSELDEFKAKALPPFEHAGFSVTFVEYNETDGRAVEFGFYFGHSIEIKEAMAKGLWEPQISGPLLN